MTRSASCIVCVSLAGVLAATFGATDARAQPTHDVVGAWASVFVAVPLGDRMEARADGILQRTDNVSWVDWELARVIIVRTLNDHLSVGGGYTWFRIGGALFGLPLLTFLPVAARDVFHANVSLYTHLLSASGAGAVGGALVAAWL